MNGDDDSRPADDPPSNVLLWPTEAELTRIKRRNKPDRTIAARSERRTEDSQSTSDGEEYKHLVFENGDKYEGDIMDGVPHGRGKLYCKGGTRYEGEFKKGNYHGLGKIFFANSGCYMGEFTEGRIEGFGHMEFDNGKYWGEWGQFRVGKYTRGGRHGYGLLVWRSGEWYEGEFSKNEYHGLGFLSLPDGRCYAGQFQNGKAHGEGILIFPDGRVHKGEFRHGRFLWRINDVEIWKTIK